MRRVVCRPTQCMLGVVVPEGAARAKRRDARLSGSSRGTCGFVPKEEGGQADLCSRGPLECIHGMLWSCLQHSCEVGQHDGREVPGCQRALEWLCNICFLCTSVPWPCPCRASWLCAKAFRLHPFFVPEVSCVSLGWGHVPSERRHAYSQSRKPHSQGRGGPPCQPLSKGKGCTLTPLRREA